MMATHHDSFCMWDTKLSKWNSVNMGPKEIWLVRWQKQLGQEVCDSECLIIQLGIFNFLNTTIRMVMMPKTKASKIYMGTQTLKGKAFASQRDINRWLDRTKELCDMYQPDLYYFDWGFRKEGFWRVEKLLSTLL